MASGESHYKKFPLWDNHWYQHAGWALAQVWTVWVLSSFLCCCATWLSIDHCACIISCNVHQLFTGPRLQPAGGSFFRAQHVCLSVCLWFCGSVFTICRAKWSDILQIKANMSLYCHVTFLTFKSQGKGCKNAKSISGYNSAEIVQFTKDENVHHWPSITPVHFGGGTVEGQDQGCESAKIIFGGTSAPHDRIYFKYRPQRSSPVGKYACSALHCRLSCCVCFSVADLASGWPLVSKTWKCQRDFDSCQWNVRDFTKSQGIVGKILVREKWPKTVYS